MAILQRSNRILDAPLQFLNQLLGGVVNFKFKTGAVRLVTEQGRQPRAVAKELGICIDTLRSWLKASGVQLGQASRLNREQQRIRELETENRALRKQLGEKEEVIEALYMCIR